MAITLHHVGRTPQQPQFGLDQFVEHHKAEEAADVVLLDSSVPQRGNAHPSYANMFVTDRAVQETGEKASALDITYTGTLTGLLPPAQNEDDDAVMSATSSFLAGGAPLTSPATVQYYAPIRVKSFITAGGPATGGFAPDPPGVTVVITYTVGDANFTPGPFINSLIAMLFQTQIIHSLKSTEIVAGQFWLNVSKKTSTLFPVGHNLGTGNIIQLYNPGSGYTVGDVLTIPGTGGQSATVSVLSTGSVFGSNGAIITFSTTSNTFTTTNTAIAATGGTGTGAEFNTLQF